MQWEKESALAFSQRALHVEIVAEDGDASENERPGFRLDSAALDALAHKPRAGGQGAWPAVQHGLQCVAGARLNRSD